ncbi:MAG: ABC transporter substrate-binding protein [Angelakisella sp.]|nr:ABC transporter substrate-binding protein [Angelakisella sp.]
MMKKLIAVLLCLVMVASMVACGGNNNEPTETGDKVITIGVFEPTSGQNGAGGKKEILGIQYANSLYPTVTIGGEEYKIELTYADNQSDASKAPTAAQQLVSKKVTAVLGTYGSSCAIAAGPYFEEAKIPAVGTSCTNPQVTQGNDYYFRVCFIDPFQGTVMAQYAWNKGITNAAVIVEAGDDYSAGFGNYFVQAFEGLGGKVTRIEFQTSETDFSGTMTTLAANGVTAIFSPVAIETAPYIITQARNAGITGPIMAGDTWDDISIIQRVTEAGCSIDDIYFSTFYDEKDEENEAAYNFATGFKAWLKEDPARITDNSESEEISAVTACGYDAYMAVYYALQAAQSTDGETLRDALAALEVKGLVTGDLKFDENGDAVKNYAVVKTPTENGFVFADAVTFG